MLKCLLETKGVWSILWYTFCFSICMMKRIMYIVFAIAGVLSGCGYMEETDLFSAYYKDSDSPFLLSATPANGSKIEDLSQVELTFSEEVTGADRVGNYALSGDGVGSLGIHSVSWLGSQTYRVLISGTSGYGPIILTLDNVNDLAGNALGLITLSYTGWWDTDWQKRRKLTFNNMDQTESLVDFPVLVKLDSTKIDHTQTQDNGEDIRFVDTNGTELKYEIEEWDESGESVVWVKVPQIDGSSNTDHVWMYYGNGSASDSQDAASVWNNGYELVMHCSESSGNLTDSTSYNRFGQPFGGVTQGASGAIGKGVSFDGSSNYVAMNMSYSGANTIPELTISVWFSTTFTGAAYNDNWAFVDFDRSDFYNFYISGDTGALEFSTSASGSSTDDFVANTSGLNNGSWYLGWAVYDGTDKIIYLNNSEDGRNSNPHGGSDLGISSTRWGFVGEGSEATSFNGTRNNIYYQGSIDEIRISSTVRSLDWIKAQYLSMIDGFISFGPEE